MTQPETFDPLIDDLPSRYVVGIDLGTTNSAVTYIDTEELPWQIRVLSIPQLVAPGETESLDTLPSFYFQPVQTGNPESREQLRLPWDKKPPAFCVGALARDETARTSGRGIASAKSWLCHAAVDRTAALLPWQGAGDVKRLSPVEVSGQYLRHIRKSWDQRFPDHPLADQDIVLTLPASFDEVARELTVEAASLAGLSRVVLIEEPQAAFYAWVYKHDSDWESRVEIGQKILVCDIGGGTTDFTLIRVRKSNEGSPAKENKQNSQGQAAQKIQFHRVAVGNHLILGGDNLDLAIAKYLEQKLTDGGKLEAYQWDILVGTSRKIKEQMLSDEGIDSMTVSLPSRGSKLIGGSLQTKATRDEIRNLIVAGFLPEVQLTDKPLRHASGFQEFGLPYASDPGITRYLAEFLTTHADAGEASSFESEPQPDNSAAKLANAKPDIVLFNGGFFASPILRTTVIERISKWFQTNSPGWSPRLLANDRLDLAVARGAAYYGIVRRDMGVRIAASLARSYYIGIGSDDSGKNQAICIMPGNAEPGQSFTLENRQFLLTLSEPVEFSIYVSSTRLADQPGQILAIDPEQMTSLPPIRTVLRAKSRNEKRDVSVKLQIGLTEIGTIDLSCLEQESDRSWKLRFDIRSTTQTDVEVHSAVGETQGHVDEQTWQACEQCIANVFNELSKENEQGDETSQPTTGTGDPKELIKQLSTVIGAPREEWPMSFLRRVWDALIEFEWSEGKKSGRRKSAKHESRWLNLLGYSLRPGYGVALDDWRVTETWRTLRGKLIHGSVNIQNESLILWRRLGGGLSRGQQSALAEPLFSSLRALEKQMEGKPIASTAAPIRPEESVEVWRLLGSLELLLEPQKIKLGNLIAKLINKRRLKNARNAMIWAWGRLGQRVPLYGPLNTVVHVEQTQTWILELMSQRESSPLEHLAIVQMARRTNDRYRDIDPHTRRQVLGWLKDANAADHLIEMVDEGGSFDVEQQGRIYGESLPQGLRMLN
ncbi:MAG: Hsp70 family protein [Mariniblastus sp.]|nr:Hsp70 family protein [Mariniblastus sp.]